MADIFISYSQDDRLRIEAIAERLASLGFSVWHGAPNSGRSAQEERVRAFSDAGVVLVTWSTVARSEVELYAEAAAAFDAGKLVQVTLEPGAPPWPFHRAPAFDLAGGSEWSRIEQAISDRMKGDTSGLQAELKLGFAPTPTVAGSPKLVAFAIAAVLSAFACALNASFNNVMSPDQLQVALVGVLGVAAACAGLSVHRFFSIIRTAR